MGQCPGTLHSFKIVAVTYGVVILIVGFGSQNGVSGEGMKCSGYCTKDILKCQYRGGKVIGYCSKNLMCCDPLVSASGTCGDRKSGQKVVFFKSPNYPGYAGGDLICELKVRIRNDTIAIRVDFLQVEMDGLSFDATGENTAPCESDMIFIRGFQNWSPPPRCGNLSGYGVVIDMDSRQTRNLGVLSVVALMSSPRYRFHMRITQVTKNPGVLWDIKESFIAKRSVPPLSPTSNPTKILIKTERPYLSTHTESSLNVETFRIFDSRNPNWKTPSVINGEDTVISTVPWQVSIRVKPPPNLEEFLALGASTTENNLEVTTEDDMTMEDSTESNCSLTEGIHFCGGTIFGDGRHILSAAHCFFGSNKLEGMANISQLMVVVGDTNKCSGDDETSIFNESSYLKSYRYDVESIVFHYGYDHSLLLNDVAIIRLNETIKYYDHVKPVALANSGDIYEGQQALVSGWGDRYSETDNNSFAIEEPHGPSILQSSRLIEVQNRSFCNERELIQLAGPKAEVLAHPKYMYILDSTICTLTRNGSKVEVNTGRGDSGGPLIAFRNGSQPVLAGIVSYSIPYDSRHPTVDGMNRTVDYYASVAFYRNWIDMAVKTFQDVGIKYH